MKCLTVVLGLFILTLINPLGNQYVQAKHTTKSRNHITLVSDVVVPSVKPSNKDAMATTPPKPVNPPAPAIPAVPVPAIPPPVTPVTPTAPSYPTNCASYLPLVEQYNWPVDTMMAIMQAESSCNPYAYNPSGCYGLFQLFGEDVTDPAGNVAGAYQIYLRQGLGAWSSWTSGIYEKYL